MPDELTEALAINEEMLSPLNSACDERDAARNKLDAIVSLARLHANSASNAGAHRLANEILRLAGER